MFFNKNPLSIALAFKKFKVVEFLLENDLLDIITCCKYSPLSLNNEKLFLSKKNITQFTGLITPSQHSISNMDSQMCKKSAQSINYPFY
mmetsp:Transcript_41535/g.39948  ORF Transcript_41535/g.39948 Transcript_41535/m.39948 type:complete len:89 (-) Transcript_41535:124-390(-)